MDIEIKGDVNLINRTTPEIDFLARTFDDKEFIFELRRNHNEEMLSDWLTKWFNSLDKTTFQNIEMYKIENAGIFVTKMKAITKLDVKIKIRIGYSSIRINIKQGN
jgi:hypothetical protein